MSVIRVQGRPARLATTARHLQQRRLKFAQLEALWIDAGWLQLGAARGPIQLQRHFESVKKGVRR